MPDVWMADALQQLADLFGTHYFMMKGIVALLIMCLLCGMVGALVVGNRMAFFSDAMAHCAFAGVALGVLTAALNEPDSRARAALMTWLVPLVIVGFGIAVGAAMVYVRDSTGLAHDTVIGVFFALALGFGAMLVKVVQQVSNLNLETFFFGNLYFVPESNLVFLCTALALVAGVFLWRYNQLMFASFNPSLARTRRMNVTINNYLFITLLALVVNLSINAVGALLINALLVVPAAAAANVSRNLRQMYWMTVGFSLASGVVGLWLSTQTYSAGNLTELKFAPSGMIVVTSVGLFFGSMIAVAVWNRFAPIFGGKEFRRPGHGPGDSCGFDHPFGQCP